MVALASFRPWTLQPMAGVTARPLTFVPTPTAGQGLFTCLWSRLQHSQLAVTWRVLYRSRQSLAIHDPVSLSCGSRRYQLAYVLPQNKPRFRKGAGLQELPPGCTAKGAEAGLRPFQTGPALSVRPGAHPTCPSGSVTLELCPRVSQQVCGWPFRSISLYIW